MKNKATRTTVSKTRVTGGPITARGGGGKKPPRAPGTRGGATAAKRK